MIPCSPVCMFQRVGGRCCLHLHVLKTEESSFSETLIPISLPMWCHVKDRSLKVQCREILWSHVEMV
jgi:hypothetical protein